MDYCYNCHKYVNTIKLIYKAIVEEGNTFHCEECKTWIKTITVPIIGENK